MASQALAANGETLRHWPYLENLSSEPRPLFRAQDLKNFQALRFTSLAAGWKYSKMPPKATAQKKEVKSYRNASLQDNRRTRLTNSIVALDHVTSL